MTIDLPPGARFSRTVPPDDDRERLVCETCNFVAYENPKIAVGAVVRAGSRILLCRRAIEPRYGYWTVPGGYMELGETTEEGAAREAWEEAKARIAVGPLLGVFSIPRISHVQLIYRATLIGDSFGPGAESLEVALFGWDEIPWDELAFPSVRWSLDADRALGDGNGPVVPITAPSRDATNLNPPQNP